MTSPGVSVNQDIFRDLLQVLVSRDSRERREERKDSRRPSELCKFLSH